MYKDLSAEEHHEVSQYGSIRCSIDEFCERREMSKVELGEILGVSRIQINNYRNADRVVEYTPSTGELKVLTQEKVVNTGSIA